MLSLYQWVTRKSARFLERLLNKRLQAGKEDPDRLDERRGIASLKRPEGALIWLHAASVGEAQSALILIDALLKRHPKLHILVTTGTLTSARRMETSLPDNAFHQFVPVDHQAWCARFLDHWHPDLALWMESELWPNLLLGIKSRDIPVVLLNARLSDRSYARWKLLKNVIRPILQSFDLILCQTKRDAARYSALGGNEVFVTDNIKHSAAPLPYNDDDLKALQDTAQGRPVCLYASTHAGEEAMAANIHKSLASHYPELLSIIVPRHPERGEEVLGQCDDAGLHCTLRGAEKTLPDEDTEIYIADTLGELGLFYRFSDIVYIGRSLSNDGGGGHNPIEAAQLGCAVLHGRHVQNLQDIYDDMHAADACLQADNETALAEHIHMLLNDEDERQKYIEKALHFSNSKSHVVDTVVTHLEPFMERL